MDTASHPNNTLRDRLLQRVAASVEAHRGLVTLRARDALWRVCTNGVREQALHDGAALIELDPGAQWSVGAGESCEWLVLSGDLALDAAGAPLRLEALDFHRGPGPFSVRSQRGARVYLHRTTGGGPTATVRADAPWDTYADGIDRRVLWHEGDQAAYLVRAARGASVPGHGHHHDEQCLMLDGDLFVGDILLRPGDWHLAPAGVRHGEHVTDTGVVLFVRGDAELDFG